MTTEVAASAAQPMAANLPPHRAGLVRLQRKRVPRSGIASRGRGRQHRRGGNQVARLRTFPLGHRHWRVMPLDGKVGLDEGACQRQYRNVLMGDDEVALCDFIEPNLNGSTTNICALADQNAFACDQSPLVHFVQLDGRNKSPSCIEARTNRCEYIPSLATENKT